MPFGFVNVKFAPDTVEADVRLGTEVWTRLPRVVAMGLAARWRAPLVSEATPRFARGEFGAWRGAKGGTTAPLVSNAVLCLPGAAAAAGQLCKCAGGCCDGARPASRSAGGRERGGRAAV